MYSQSTLEPKRLNAGLHSGQLHSHLPYRVDTLYRVRGRPSPSSVKGDVISSLRQGLAKLSLKKSLSLRLRRQARENDKAT